MTGGGNLLLAAAVKETRQQQGPLAKEHLNFLYTRGASWVGDYSISEYSARTPSGHPLRSTCVKHTWSDVVS
jgi:hypothetical protein